MDNLTEEEKAASYHTMQHIRRVGELMNIVVVELLKRAIEHDKTKLQHPEVEHFTRLTPLLSTSKFGSEEYNGFLKELKPALDHHYARNRHHPQHFANGVNDMNLLDILEMLVDWKASSENQNGGNIRQSLDINAERFGINTQLYKILKNTIELFE